MSTRVSDARWTGVFYLGLALASAFGFLFVRGQLFVADDAAATLNNLVDQAPLTRLGVAATWDIGGLFFGLWLIPMGYVVLTSRVMPIALGWAR